jgi:type II secretory pathway pseudopilin PulG
MITKYKLKYGQSLIEILVAVGVGTIMLLGAITALSPVIKSSTDANRSQVGAVLGKELLDNVRVFSQADWHNVSSLATSSANKYYLAQSTSGYVGAINFTSDVGLGVDSVLMDGSPTGTVGYWKMNDVDLENSYPLDSGGWRNVLFRQGLPTSVSGKYGKGFHFEGGAFLYTSMSLPSTSTSYTFMAWVKTASTSVPILSNRAWGGSLFFGIDSEGREYVDDSACSSAVATGTVVNDDSFHFLVYARNGSENARALYVDGALVKSDSVTGCSAIDKVLDIGRDTPPATYFTGTLDEVRAFSRALSAAEIQNIYKAQDFYRYFYVNDVYRDDNGTIKLVRNVEPYDPSTKHIIVEYYWGNVPEKSLSIYLTRFANRTLWQTDWSGGAGVDGPASTTRDAFSTSSGIDFATTSGSIRIEGL